MRPGPQRAATIEVEQAPNGSWNVSVRVVSPALRATSVQGAEGFHNAGDALDWARYTIENVVASPCQPGVH